MEEKKRQVRQRRQERLRLKKQRILDAAIKVFTDKGYQLSRIADIAREADVAYGLVYRYFTSKDLLLLEIFQVEWKRLMLNVKNIADGDKNARDKLLLIADSIFNAFKNNPRTVSLMVRDVLRNIRIFDQEKIDILEELHLIVSRVIREGQKKKLFDSGVDDSMASLMFCGALDQIVTAWALNISSLKGKVNIDLAKKMIERVLVKSLEKR